MKRLTGNDFASSFKVKNRCVAFEPLGRYFDMKRCGKFRVWMKISCGDNKRSFHPTNYRYVFTNAVSTGLSGVRGSISFFDII